MSLTRTISRRWPRRSWLLAPDTRTTPPLHEALLSAPGVHGARLPDGTPLVSAVSLTAFPDAFGEVLAGMGDRAVVYEGPRVCTLPFDEDNPLAIVRESAPRAIWYRTDGTPVKPNKLPPHEPGTSADARAASAFLRAVGWYDAHAIVENGVESVLYGYDEAAITATVLRRAHAHAPAGATLVDPDSSAANLRARGRHVLPLDIPEAEREKVEAQLRSSGTLFERDEFDRIFLVQPETFAQSARLLYAQASTEAWAPPRDENPFVYAGTLVAVSTGRLPKYARGDARKPEPFVEVLVAPTSRSPSTWTRYEGLDNLWLEWA